MYQVTRAIPERSNEVSHTLPDSSIQNQSTIVPSMVVPSAPTRPPFVQVYSRRWETNDTYAAPTPSSSDPHPSDPTENIDLPIALRKGTHLQIHISHW